MRKMAVIFMTVFLIFRLPYAQKTIIDWKIHNVGKVHQVITNNGALNAAGLQDNLYNFPYLINCEFPANTGEEHIYLSGLWIGAINSDGDTLVSATRSHFTPDEFFASDADWDTVWVIRKGDTVDIPYWPGYTAVSDQDFVCSYSDYNLLNIENHNPLYLDVIQNSYAWSSPPLDEFIVLRYDLIPTKDDIKEVYISYWQQGEVGDNSINDNWIDDLTRFFPEEHLAATIDGPGGNDGNSFSPIGIKVLYPADTGNLLNWGYHHYRHADLDNIRRDKARYEKISNGVIMEDLLEPQRSHLTITFGPFEEVQVGDTLHFEIALVFGQGLDGMMKNAEYLEFLSSRNYKVPSPPPKPQLHVRKKSREIYLNWHPEEGVNNPEEYKDSYRGDGEDKPFEGYRLYKSTKSINGPWTLLADFDLEDNVYGFNTGLQYEYTDRGLLNNFKYYYTLTAYSKPDSISNFPSMESSLSDNSQLVIPSTLPPDKVGKVSVVPNPYRGDIAYHKFDPPWEEVSGSRRWMEQDRLIQFINLPVDCEIKIYTLAGNHVNTILHYSDSEGYENWNLTSSVGQAVASGLYLFAVKDNTNGDVQIGKFVIIK